MRRIIWLVLLSAIVTATGTAAPVVTFTLNPFDGIRSGAPGTSVGWGFTVDTSSDYVLITSFGFEDQTPVGDQAGWFLGGIPFTLASVGSPFTAPYIEGSSGLQYDIWPTATVGQHTSGRIWLVYEAYSDPDATIPIEEAMGITLYAQFSAADVIAQVNVTEGQVEIPEPASLLLAGGVLILFVRRRRAS